MTETTTTVQTPWERFVSVVFDAQSYLNLLYLVLAFPLGIFYFVFLITGLSLGFSLIILWIGIPILLLVLGGWWALAAFERALAVGLLHVDIPKVVDSDTAQGSLAIRFRKRLSHPATWKALVYLFARFPLGILSFVVVVTLSSVSIGLMAVPLVYESAHFSLGYELGGFYVDTLSEALMFATLGAAWGSLHSMQLTASRLFRAVLRGSCSEVQLNHKLR